MKQLVLASAAVLALAAGAASAAPTAAGHGKVVAPPAVTAGTIYSNNKTDSGIGIVSQNFESSFDIYDARAADDFPIKKKAVVSEVDVTGVYFNGSGPARDENVTFYKDAGGLPGAVVKDYTGVAGADSFGSFKIKVPKTKLKKGTYWVSVQANMDFAVGGEWGWENNLETTGAPAAWENPGGGFGVGCATYTNEATCIPDGQGDHMFSLIGKGH